MHPLDQWLTDNNRSREWLAEKIGTTEASLSRIVNGKQWPSRETFRLLAKITKGAVTANDFLPERAEA